MYWLNYIALAKKCKVEILGLCMEQELFNEDDYKQDFLSITEKLNNLQIKTIPLKFKDKKPYKGKNWNTKQLTFVELEQILDETLINLAVQGGAVSDNLFILDFDDIYHYDFLYNSNEKFKYICDNTYQIQTSRGVHVYLRGPYPIKSAKDKNWNIDIQGQNKYAVTAPSVHPNGNQYKPYKQASDNIFIYPLENVKELDFTDKVRRAGSKPIPKLHTPKNGAVEGDTSIDGVIDPEYTLNVMGAFYRDIIRNKLTKNRYGKFYYKFEDGTFDKPDRSRADEALILYLIKDGYRFEDVKAVYSKYAAAEGKYKQKGIHRNSYLRTSFNAAENRYFEKRNNIDEFIDTAWLIIKTSTFYTGRNRNSLTLVSMAILYRMKRTGILAVNVAIRDIELITGLASQTVRNTIKKLKELKYIELTKESIGSFAAEYKFTELFLERIDKSKGRTKLQTKPISTHYAGDYIKQGLNRLILYDLLIRVKDGYSRNSLNRNAGDLVGILNSNIGKELLLRDLVKELNMDSRTIQRKIEKLQRVVSVVRGRKINKGKSRPMITYTLNERITDAKLQELAEKTGSVGTENRRVNRIKKDRDNYQLLLDNQRGRKDYSHFGEDYLRKEFKARQA